VGCGRLMVTHMVIARGGGIPGTGIRRSPFAFVLAALVVVAAACGPSAPPTPNPDGSVNLRIGFTASRTGSLEVTSLKQVKGLETWAADVRAAGGIHLADGRVLMPQLVSYDDESRTDRVQALYQKLINTDRVDVLVSPYSSGLIKAAAVVSEQNGKVMITAGGADDATMSQGFTGIYQVYTPASAYLEGAIDLALALDPTIHRIAIVNEKDAFSTSVADAAGPYATAKGLEVVLDEGYDSGTTDFGPFLNKIAAASPDAIIGGGHLADGQTLARQLTEKQVPARFVALLVAPPDPTFAKIGDAALGVVGPSQWEPSVGYSAEAAAALGIPYVGPTVAEFTAAYKAATGAAPTYHAAGGYAAGLVLAAAIERAGSTDTAAVEQALDGLDVMTFFGHLRFSGDQRTHGKQIAHQMVYVQWQRAVDGTLHTVVVWPQEAATVAAQLRTTP